MNTQIPLATELARLGCQISQALGLCTPYEEDLQDKADDYTWWTWFSISRGR